MTKIYSTSSTDCVFATYKARPKNEQAGECKIEKSIEIKGRANVRDPKTGQSPKFAVTEVNKDELEMLKASKPFMRKVNAGFISIGKEPESKKDKSAQLTSSELKAKAPQAKKVKASTDEEA